MGTFFAVGKQYPLPGKVTEGLRVHFEPLLFTIGLSDLTREDVERFKEERVHLYLQELDGMLHIAAKTAIGWVDGFVVVQSAKNEGDGLGLPPVEAHQGYGLHILLVDARTQIIRAQRMVGLSTKFSQGLYMLWLKHRNDEPILDGDFHNRVQRVVDRFPNPKELAVRATYSYRTGDR